MIGYKMHTEFLKTLIAHQYFIFLGYNVFISYNEMNDFR